ncbi:MAG: sporulation protein YtfJ [Clostridia bacterium]|jgi:sporulation protein YtfJ|nr:sporulation protein YtfJ [Clostridia bacterium]
MENKVKELMGLSIDKIKEMVDVNTVIGEPMVLADGMTLIPVSRVSYGFASGGSDLPTKGTQELFGGGGGAGINITPIAFLVIREGNVRVVPMVSMPDSINQVVNMVPDVVDKIGGLFNKDKK